MESAKVHHPGTVDELQCYVLFVRGVVESETTYTVLTFSSSLTTDWFMFVSSEHRETSDVAMATSNCKLIFILQLICRPAVTDLETP